MTDAASNMLGTVIEGRYRLAARLGDGAVGSVYRAEDLSGGPALAIKVWRTSVLDPLAAGRFHRETKALATLEHPHIVAIRDYGLVDGMPYLAMELLHGESLADYQERNGPLREGLALAVLAQILDALAYAHARNVVHRDLKPENVFLMAGPSREVGVKLLDYGLAKFLHAEDDPVPGSVLTRKGIMVGTPLYVAPEQALGGTIDARADVYSVGCVLFEMLTGQPPFMAESITELLRAHLASPIPRLSDYAPELAQREPRLQALLDRAMAKDVDDRYEHAGEMLREVQRGLAPAFAPKPLRAHESKPAPARTVTAELPPSDPVLTLEHEPASVPEKPRSRTWLWLLFALLAAAGLLLRWQL